MLKKQLMAFSMIVGAALTASPRVVHAADNPSIFIRYQYDLPEILNILEKAQGKPLDANSSAAKWLDEMGWRSWVKDAQAQPFTLTQKMRDELNAQDKLLSDSFRYKEGDVVWVPTEKGEKPYGFESANVNARGQIKKILKGDKATYFVVDVGVDNGAPGMQTVPGEYYNGHKGPVLDYGKNFKVTKKTYVYSYDEIERYNAPFRSEMTDSKTGTRVDYVKDVKWLDKISKFKDYVAEKHLEVDFLKPENEVYTEQKKLIKAMFHFFKMNRNAPEGGPMLGDKAAGGGNCFAQACVLSHAVHAVGEPYGIKAINISGSTVNPMGGHGFVRVALRGPEETHVFDGKIDDKTGALDPTRGIEIKSDTINFISDPGWGDFGTTPDTFAMTPIEEAINPNPVDANRAVYDILQGESFEDVIVADGNKGAFVSQGELRDQMFHGVNAEDFLKPKGQIAEASELERALGSELKTMVDDAKALKAKGLQGRALKSDILSGIVESKAGRLAVPNMGPEDTKILVTEYLFRSVK